MNISLKLSRSLYGAVLAVGLFLVSISDAYAWHTVYYGNGWRNYHGGGGYGWHRTGWGYRGWGNTVYVNPGYYRNVKCTWVPAHRNLNGHWVGAHRNCW